MPKFRILCFLCTESIGHSAGAHETLEMLGEMLDSFDQPEQSSTEQGRAKVSKVVRCSVKCWIRLISALDSNQKHVKRIEAH